MIYSSLTERLKTQHTTINVIIANLNNELMEYHPEPGKWSIHDNIAHLATYQPIYFGRIQQILLEDGPAFGPYKADVDDNFIAWRDKPVTDLINKIVPERENIIKLVNSLSEVQLSRTGTHLKYGSLTILEWTEFFLLHEAHHLFTIFQLAHNI